MRLTRLASALVLALVIPDVARAQGTARSMDFDLSIPSAGMGGASNAVFWSDIDHWGNPALLGYAHGVRYVHTRTQLVPGLPARIFLMSDVVRIGGGGIGLVSSGKPFGSGGVLLDYGLSQGTDPSGNPTSTFRSFESVKSIGVGISALRLLESGYALAGHEAPGWSRYGDLSAGMNSKEVRISLAPGTEGRTSARDWGLHARVTPIDNLDRAGGPPLRIDFAFGLSVLSANDDAVITFLNEDVATPVTRHHRRGAAVRVAAGRTPDHDGSLQQLFVSGLTPLLAISAAIDHADLGRGSAIEFETHGTGQEVAIANLAFLRHGHYRDAAGEIDGDTWGWGVGLPLGAVAGARFDQAWWPQLGGLPHVRRRQFAVWLDPVALFRTVTRNRPI
jgi:hypothetical protein